MNRRGFLRLLAMLAPALALPALAREQKEFQKTFDDVDFKIDGERGILLLSNKGVVEKTFYLKDIHIPGCHVHSEVTLFGEKEVSIFHIDFNFPRTNVHLISPPGPIDHITLTPPTVTVTWVRC